MDFRLPSGANSTQCPAYDQFCFQPSPLLPDHAHLLRECAAAPGPRLLDHRLRRHCAAQAGAGHRDLVSDRHRRARAEDRAVRRTGRAHAGGVCHRDLRRSFAALWDRLGLTYDDFIRTTEERHKRGVQHLFATLRDKGFIYKGSYTGQYCVSDEAYVDGPPGTPCPDCGRMTETVSEENYFFKLSAFERKLLEFYEANPGFMGPESTRREVISFVRGGLKDLSVSRTSFSWGIPVPGDEKHVIYVWLDALANYITALGYGSDDPQDQERFRKFWPADMHLIGKEISRFHCVYWPAFLMAAGIALPRSVRANGWLLFDQGKMSKSRGNIVRAETVHGGSGGRRSAVLPAARDSLRPGRQLQLRCAGAALQRRPGQRLRQPGEPRGEHGAQILWRGGAEGGRGDRCRGRPARIARCALLRPSARSSTI